MSGRKSVDLNKINKKTKCGICENDFVDCEDPNLPVQNPCGCIFHEYCLYKYGGDSYCKGSRCGRTASGSSRSGSSGCKDCKDLHKEIKQLTSENSKLNKKVEQLSEKSCNAEDLRKENKRLTTEISKLKRKIEQVTKIASK